MLAHLAGGTVELDNQRGLGVPGDWRLRLGGVDREAIHHLDCCWHDTFGDDRGDGVACCLGRRKHRHERLDVFGLRQQIEQRLGDDADGAFAADHDAKQIEARRVWRLAAEFDNRAVRQHDGRRQYVIDGKAIFEAVSAAGVLGQIATNRADLLAGGVGCVVEAERSGDLADPKVRDAGLHTYALVGAVDVEHLTQARQADHDAIFGRQCPARQAGAGTTGHERDTVLVTETHDGRDLLGRAGQDHRARHGAVVRQAVTLVDAQLGAVGHDPVGTNDVACLCRDGERTCRIGHGHVMQRIA